MKTFVTVPARIKITLPVQKADCIIYENGLFDLDELCDEVFNDDLRRLHRLKEKRKRIDAQISKLIAAMRTKKLKRSGRWGNCSQRRNRKV